LLKTYNNTIATDYTTYVRKLLKCVVLFTVRIIDYEKFFTYSTLFCWEGSSKMNCKDNSYS